MKTILTMIVTSLFFAAQAQASTIKIDGFCTMDILAMERANHIDYQSPSIRGFSKEYFDASLARAKEHYAEQEIYYDENANISIFKASVLFGKDAIGNGKRLIGTKITLWAQGDEDHITYFFYRETGSDKPLLKMFLHDDQSATSYWNCETL